jgi:hypothetical protein
MNTQQMTAEQIRQAGIELLTKHLGITGMIRFFQQNELGHGDYTGERRQWLGQLDSKTLMEELRQWREARRV